MAEALVEPVDSAPTTQDTGLDDYQDRYIRDGSTYEALKLEGLAKLHGSSNYISVQVTCSNTKLSLTTNNKKIGIVDVLFEDILGLQIVDKPPSEYPGSCAVVIHSFVLRSSGFFTSTRQRRHEMIPLLFTSEKTAEDNIAKAKEWKSQVMSLCRKCCMETFVYDNPHKRRADGHDDAGQSPHYLILINPAGGKGLAVEQFRKKIQPMFDIADIRYTNIVTERQGHARELIKTYDISSIDGIIISSGDGLLYEVINGLMARQDWRQVISVPIGMLPTGSGNALCSSILHESQEDFSLENAAFLIIRGGVGPMDLAMAQTTSGKTFFNVVVGWGLISDVDIESEKWRRFGDIRFQMGGLVSIMKKKVYRARLWYLPEENDSSGDEIKTDTNGKEPSEGEQGFEETPQKDGNNLEQESNEVDVINQESKSESNVKSGNDHHQDAHQPQDPPCPDLVPRYLSDLSDPVPSSWKLIEGDFILISVMTMTHIGRDMYGALEAKIGGGIFHIFQTISTASRLHVLNMMLTFKDGLPTNDQRSFLVKSKAFRLEPITPDGLLTLDGEKIEYGPLQCELFQGLCRIMTRNRQK